MNHKLKNYPFWIICLSFCIGVFFSSLYDHMLFFSSMSFFLLLAFIIYSFKRKPNQTFLTLVAILFIILGTIRHQIANLKYSSNHLTNKVHVDQVNKLIFSIKEIFKESKKSRKYKVRIHHYNNENTDGYALLSIPKNSTNSKLNLGDTFITYSKLKLLKETGNPYAFEYTNYLKNMGITHKLWVTNQQLYQIKTLSNPWNIFFNTIRSNIEERLQKQALNPQVLQITEALVLGNKSSLNQNLKTNFVNAGVIHILAISGLHIGILFFILNGIFSLLLPYSKNSIYVTISIIAILWLFTWFSGSSPSALRATTMFTCFQISKSILRHQHPINALFLSILILVLIDPNIVFSVGFQLSITAVAGIIIGVPKLLALWYPKNWFVNKIWSITCMSLCAQISILPLSIYYFHQFSSLFLLANIPIMLAIVFILSGAILIVAASYFGQIPNLIINIYNHFIGYLIDYVEWVSKLDLFIIKKLYINSVSFLFIYILYAYSMYLYKKPRRAYKWSLAILSLILFTGFGEYNQRLLKSDLWLLNNYNNTIITELTSDEIKIHSTNSLSNTDTTYITQPIINNLHYSKVDYHVLQNNYSYKEDNIFIINSKNQFRITENAIFILDKSPKINLERLIKNHSPKLVIASAHNYSNLIKKWKATCSKEQVAFYSVSENGALNLTNTFTHL